MFNDKNRDLLTIIFVVVVVFVTGILVWGGVGLYKKYYSTKHASNNLKTENNIENQIIKDNETDNTIDITIADKITFPTSSENIMVVPTMRDEITTDSTWCGTFQLVWNDMKNEIVKKDVIFTPQEKMADNLNKEEFTQEMLSDEYYFKIYGLKSLELKEQIEKGIKEKFNQESDILEDFNWSPSELDDPNNANVRRYFFYVMLYRKFEYLQEFDKLENGKFGDKYNDIEYFGIDRSTKNSVGNQIDVLYYNSQDDFAIVINTKTNDEVIFCKNPKGNTFIEIYENMNKETEQYKGSKEFKDVDEFMAPKLTFNEKREYKELQDKYFDTADGESAIIVKAIQTVQFTLDEKGGEIKSEAAIDAIVIQSIDEPRYFYVDDTFAIFLREKGKKVPYFAGRIEDITKFQ